MKETSVFFIAMCIAIACCSAAESSKDQRKEKLTTTPSELQTLKSSTAESITTETIHKDLQVAQQTHQSAQTKGNLNSHHDNQFSHDNIRRRPDHRNQNRATSNLPISPRQRLSFQPATTEATLSTFVPHVRPDPKQFSKKVQSHFQSNYKERIPSGSQQAFPAEGRRQQNFNRQQNAGRNVLSDEHFIGMKEGQQPLRMSNLAGYPGSQINRNQASGFGIRDSSNVQGETSKKGTPLKERKQFNFGSQQFGEQVPNYGRQQGEFSHQFNPYRKEVRNQEQYYRPEQNLKMSEQSYRKGTEFEVTQQGDLYPNQQPTGLLDLGYAAQGDAFNEQQVTVPGSDEQVFHDQYYNTDHYYNTEQGMRRQEFNRQKPFLTGHQAVATRSDQQLSRDQYYTTEQQRRRQEFNTQQAFLTEQDQQAFRDQYYNHQQQMRGQDFRSQNHDQFANGEGHVNRNENVPFESYQSGRDESVYGLNYKSNPQNTDFNGFQESGLEQFSVQPINRRVFAEEDQQGRTLQSVAKNAMLENRNMPVITEKKNKEQQIETTNRPVHKQTQVFQENSSEMIPIDNQNESNIFPESRSLQEAVVLRGPQSLPIHPALIYTTGEIPSSHAVVLSSDSSQQGGASVRSHLQTPHIQYIYRHPL